MKVNLDKNLDTDVFYTIKTAIGYPPINVNNLCKKACQKLNALVHLAPFMSVDKKE